MQKFSIRPLLAALACCAVGTQAIAGNEGLTEKCNTRLENAVLVETQPDFDKAHEVSHLLGLPENAIRYFQPKKVHVFEYTPGVTSSIQVTFDATQDIQQIMDTIRTDAKLVAAGATGVRPDTQVCVLKQPAETTTNYEFYNRDLDHYVIAFGIAEAYIVAYGGWGEGWVYTGETFTTRLPDSCSPTRLQVHRFASVVDEWPPSLAYLAEPASCGYVRKYNTAWNYLGPTFAAFLPEKGVCPTGSIPVYQSYNNGGSGGVSPNHRYTTNPETHSDMVSKGWKDDGVVYCVVR